MNGAGALTRLGAYRVERPLGRGGMGEVFLAWDRRLRRHVAIKRVRRDKADAAHRVRFRREARAAARLSHPALVQIFDVLATEDGDCIVMEHVEGTGLEERIARGPLELGTALAYARDIAAGLAEAHEKGLVHRDLKAANVRVTTSPPRAKVLDFGLALTLDDSTGESSDSLEIEGIAGTIYAMAPEQVLGRAVDHRCDLFALGGLLFHMLTGRPPFVGQGLEEMVEHILSREPPRVRDLRPEVPAAVEKLIEGLLEKSPARRTSDTRWVAARLDHLTALAAGAEPAEPTLEPARGVGAVSTIHGEVIRTEKLDGESALTETITSTTALRSEEKRPAVSTLVLSRLVGPEGQAPELDEALRVHHDEKLQDLCARFRALPGGRNAGSILAFQRSAEAVGFALAYHQAVGELAPEQTLCARTAVHLCEIDDEPGGLGQVDDTALRILTHLAALAEPRQILLTRAAFDLARYAAVAGPLADPDLRWLAHGSYYCEGLTEPLLLCEVGVVRRSALAPPSDRKTSRRLPPAGGEVALGWRPAAGQPVPRRPDWELLDKIGEGSFGEVWLAVHPYGEKRAFKFCVETARVHALKREVTLLRLLKESLGHRDDIARLHGWSFDEAPFFLELEYSEGGNLVEWVEARGSLAALPMETRLELVAEAAEALAAAHSVGILHKDVKPQNILVRIDDDGAPHAVLTDFGIGALTDPQRLENAAFTVLGFSQTTPTTSSAPSGTPGYLAPERLEGKPPTVRSDIYSLGVTLFQVAVGDLRRAMAPGWQREIRDEVLRSDLAIFVDGDPERRPGRAMEIAERLRSLAARREQKQQVEAQRTALLRSQRRRRQVTWIAAAAAVLAAVIAFFGLRADRARRQAQNLARAALAGQLLDQGRVNDGSLLLLEVRDPGATPTAVESLNESLSQPVETTLYRGHTGAVENIAWSGDGRRLVSASHDRTARIWTVEGELIAVLDGHEATVWDAVWSGDGSRILTVSFDQTARIWDAEGAPLAVLEGHTNILRGGGWNAEGTRVLTLSEDRTARIWDPESGDTVAVLHHPRGLRAGGWSPDSRRIVAMDWDGRGWIWDAGQVAAKSGVLGGATFKSRRSALVSLDGHEHLVIAVAWSPDGRRLATASQDQTARIWDAETGAPLAVLRGHESVVSDVAWSGDGQRLVTSSHDRTARVWDAQTGAELTVLRGHTNLLWDAGWSPEDRRIITNGDDREARLWDPETGLELAALRGHEARVWAAEWSPAGDHLLTASEDATVRLWDLETGTALKVLRLGEGAEEPVVEPGGEIYHHVVWSGDERRVLHSFFEDTSAYIRTIETAETVRINVPPEERIFGIDWSRRGVRLLTRSRRIPPPRGTAAKNQPMREKSRTLRLRDAQGALVADLGRGRRVEGAFWSHDGSRIFAYAEEAKIWDAATGETLVRFKKASGRIWDAAWSRDARAIAVASADRKARVFDAATGETRAVLAGHGDQVQSIAWSPDETRVVTGSRDRTARLWDLASGETRLVLRGHTDWIWDVGWSDGGHILTVGMDRTARLWDSRTGELLATYQDHEDRITAAAWSPDGQRFATASLDHTVRFWAAVTDHPAYLQARIRARNRFCLEPSFHLDVLGLTPSEAERRHGACRACVPAFFQRLDGAPLWEWPAYAEAWDIYAACFTERVGGRHESSRDRSDSPRSRGRTSRPG